MENSENREYSDSMEYSDSASSQGGRTGNGVTALAAKAEEKVREIGGTAQQRIDAGRDKVASGLEDAATKLREGSDTAGSMGHSAGETVAVKMEAAAGYLHEHKSNEIAGDLGSYIEGHPVQSIIAAALLGFFLGRLVG
jgi:ElaB/YqjD/DUF883 family membrane-anchored ribosome-binding protein